MRFDSRPAAAWVNSLFVDHAVFRMIWTNLAEVIPGRWYRANHPTPGRIGRLVARHGIRTIVNLRGSRNCGSDALSRDAAARLGLDHVYMAFESRGAPHRERILRFHAIWRQVKTPVLMHCKSGADRAGLMSALYSHTKLGQPIEIAAKQLSLRYGHIRQADTGILDHFFEEYLRFNAATPMPFWNWVDTVYEPEAVTKSFQANGAASRILSGLLRRE